MDARVEVTDSTSYVLLLTLLTGYAINYISTKTKGAIKTTIFLCADRWIIPISARQNVTQGGSFVRKADLETLFPKTAIDFIINAIINERKIKIGKFRIINGSLPRVAGRGKLPPSTLSVIYEVWRITVETQNIVKLC